MAPAKDKWVRRFIITETRRHKKGFTIYKVTSVVFLKSSHEEVSKIFVWKRYNDFKKLHSELNNLHKHLGIKESFPTLPKSKYFGRFEAEVVEERKKYALQFLEFVGRYSYLYSSDIFITFFETSHVDNYTSDCTHSLSSDTSEDDHIIVLNDPVLANDITAQSTFQCLSKTSHNVLTNSCSALSNVICTNENKSHNASNIQNTNVKKGEQSYKTAKLHVQDTIVKDCDTYIRNKNLDKNNVANLSNVSGFDSLNNNINKDLSNYNTTHSQTQPDPSQYLLIAAAHISAAFKHESIAEYEEAFIQYKLGISCLINGVQFDPDSTRIPSITDKISKYLARAEQLYNRHLNCNISIVNKPVSELQYYKVFKVMKSVMLVTDIRANCNRIIKTIEKSSIYEDNINNYILRGQVPYMVYLHACMETETTVFLILQYASRGKLWDFIRLHYKVSDNSHTNIISNYISTNEHVNEEFNGNENVHELNKTDKVIKNNTLQEDHQYFINAQNKIYTEVPTIQLLEKSQKLLQSVNATLKKSDSVANRLNESKELKHSENMSSLNAKAITQMSQELDLTSYDIYHDKSSNPNNINKGDVILADLSIKNFVENKDLRCTNSLSINDSMNWDISENICVSTSNKSCTTRCNSFKNKTNDLFYNNFTSKAISVQNVPTNNDVVDVCKNNDTGSIINDILNWTYSSNVTNCNIDETQYPWHSCKEINIDEEQELWQIPEAVIRPWAAEILLALEVLHQQNVLILDFKPDNILLDDAGHILLTYIVPQRNVELSKLKYPYSSPELVMFSPTTLVTSATDIWSFGVILYELFTGITFVIKNPGLFHSHSTINIPSKLSESTRSLLYGMLKYHPDERLTIDEIKRHPFFAEIDWSSIINSQT